MRPRAGMTETKLRALRPAPYDPDGEDDGEEDGDGEGEGDGDGDGDGEGSGVHASPPKLAAVCEIVLQLEPVPPPLIRTALQQPSGAMVHSTV